jgi:hypothetical protein
MHLDRRLTWRKHIKAKRNQINLKVKITLSNIKKNTVLCVVMRGSSERSRRFGGTQSPSLRLKSTRIHEIALFIGTVRRISNPALNYVANDREMDESLI